MKKLLIGRFTNEQQTKQPLFWNMDNISMKCNDDYAIVENLKTIELVKIVGVTAVDDEEILGSKKVLMTLSSKDFRKD